MKKERKKQQEELLGMSLSVAERKLRKLLILDLFNRLGFVCPNCGNPIQDPEDFAIRHIKHCDTVSQYFDLSNIVMSHDRCGVPVQGMRQKANKMIKPIIEDINGVPLRATFHQGKIYVAGTPGQKYQIRIKNSTESRYMAVVTVDGLDVLTGQPGSVDAGGYVLDTHRDFVIKGWRTSDNEVAAFEFGTPSESYSSKLGTPANVGVIGLAYFAEERMPWKVQKVPWENSRNRSPYWIQPPNPYWGGIQNPYGIGPSNPYEVIGQNPWNTQGTLVSTNVSQGEVSTMSAHTPTKSFESKGGTFAQDIGTSFGETLTSPVRNTSFKKSSNTPIAVEEIYYATLESLIEAGIMSAEPPVKKPQAFPASQKYCQPPK